MRHSATEFFAVATALFVLDIKVPPVSTAGDPLVILLVRQWPSYLAFATSFATILIMWVNHHRLFTHIGRADDRLLFSNGLLLFAVTVVPFSTSLVCAYLGHSGQRAAATIYNGTFILAAIFFNLLWATASARGRLLRDDADHNAVQGVTRSFRWGLPIYTAAFALAFVSVTASMALNLMLAFWLHCPPSRRLSARQSPEWVGIAMCKIG